MFRIAADSLAFRPEELLMVGDRVSHDRGVVAFAITTLLAPPLRTVDVPRNLGVVLAMLDSAHA
jgi:FMN phosphatase YigB (HAD superfamily)